MVTLVEFPPWVWIPTAPPSLGRYLAASIQPVPIIPVIGLVLAIAYSAGAIRLWTRHQRWPVTRALCFLVGCALLIVVMGAGIEGYGYRLFSVFMFQQLTLMMAIPILLVLGSPGTLLLRATPHHGAGRVILVAALWGLRARPARVLLHPGVMIPLFLLMFYGLYLSGLADILLRTWGGHLGLELAFLASGILFTIPLISVDPLPRKQTHFGRLIDVFAEMPLHAFFGVIVMMATLPLLDYFASSPAGWNVDPIKDQQIAGGLAWGYGELPTIIILIALLIRWERDDTTKADRATRAADAFGDAEFEAYNRRLHNLNRSQ